MSINLVIVNGHLGADPELRSTSAGQPVANFTLATNERWTDKSGQAQERAEWHRIVVWGAQAQVCHQYLRKGREVLVQGRLQTREWTNNEGQKQYTTEIVASHVQFLGAAKGPASAGDTEPMPPSAGELPTPSSDSAPRSPSTK